MRLIADSRFKKKKKKITKTNKLINKCEKCSFLARDNIIQSQ